MSVTRTLQIQNTTTLPNIASDHSMFHLLFYKFMFFSFHNMTASTSKDPLGTRAVPHPFIEAHGIHFSWGRLRWYHDVFHILYSCSRRYFFSAHICASSLISSGVLIGGLRYFFGFSVTCSTIIFIGNNNWDIRRTHHIFRPLSLP